MSEQVQEQEESVPVLSQEFKDLCPDWAKAIESMRGLKLLERGTILDKLSYETNRDIKFCGSCVVGESWYGKDLQKYLDVDAVYDDCEICEEFSYAGKFNFCDYLAYHSYGELVELCNNFADHWVTEHGDGRKCQS